jgi:hypothetical protein
VKLFDGVPHREVGVLDSEFWHPDGERQQQPRCLVWKGLYSGTVVRMWKDELLASTRPPFDTSADTITVVYNAQAEIGTFNALWRRYRSKLMFDLYPEFRRIDNVGPRRSGSMLAAAEHYGIPHMSAADKRANRKLFTDQNTWTEAEKRRGVAYCESDVDTEALLLPHILRDTPCLGQAFIRSEYVCCLADINENGIPIDTRALDLVRSHWDYLKGRIIAEAHARYGTYPNGHWSTDAFEGLLERLHIDFWPRSEATGRPVLDGDTFKEMARLYPELEMLRETRNSVGKIRPVDFFIGADGRCRAHLFPFGTVTGRNAPRHFPFMPAKWTRCFMRPEPGRAVAYCDWVGQELGELAAFSGDHRMMDAYASDDFYLATAANFGMLRGDLDLVRDRFKTIALGINYGMSGFGLAHRLDIGYAEGDDLVQRYYGIYPKARAFTDAMLDCGMSGNLLISPFGWEYHVTEATNPRALRNVILQSAGSDMLRLAVIALRADSIDICATVHDAIMVEAAEADIEAVAEHTKRVMNRASEVTTGGFPLRVEAKIFRGGERYRDKRGVPMWNRVARLIREAPEEACASARDTPDDTDVEAA